MERKLSDWTLEELWQLFPVFLTEHQDCWAEWYAGEQAALSVLLPPGTRISHIGSTAVPGIWAKPIIDILAEVPPETSLSDLCRILSQNGWLCMSQGSGRVSLNKGYTKQGFAEKVFHLHIRYRGDNDEL